MSLYFHNNMFLIEKMVKKRYHDNKCLSLAWDIFFAWYQGYHRKSFLFSMVTFWGIFAFFVKKGYYGNECFSSAWDLGQAAAFYSSMVCLFKNWSVKSCFNIYNILVNIICFYMNNRSLCIHITKFCILTIFWFYIIKSRFIHYSFT